MANQELVTEWKSAERLAFEHYLRTGRRISLHLVLENKFNPYHDPRNGRFTFAPGGPRSLPHVIVSDRRGLHGKRQRAPNDPPPADARAEPEPAVYRPDENPATLQPAQYRPNPRARQGGNGGPPLNDPITLERTFPGLANSPAASIVSLADNILDLTGPANRLTTQLAEDHISLLLRQIKTIDPSYRLDMLGFPKTLEGQINLIRQMRIDRALAFYRVRGEVGPLQVEVLRFIRDRTDRAYDLALQESARGMLNESPSRNLAIGNFVDRAVKRSLQTLYNRLGIDTAREGPIRISGREYSEPVDNKRPYRVPDARIGSVAFDVSLVRKTAQTKQVQGFFKSEWQPDLVIIIRPSQLGGDTTYAITRPGDR